MSVTSNIFPSNFRMLQSIRSTLSGMKEKEGLSPFALSQLGTIDQLLNEMMLRIDVAPYADLYAGLIATLNQGQSSGWLAASGRFAGDTISQQALPATLDPELSTDAYGGQLAEAFAAVTSLAEIAFNAPDKEARAFVEAAVNHELQLYKLRRRQAPPPVPEKAPIGIDLDVARIEAYLAKRLPEKGYSIAKLTVVPGGYQKITALLELRDRTGQLETLIVRADKADKFANLDASWVTEEYDILRFVHEGGVASAEPKWLEPDAGALGAPFMVTGWVPGKAMAVTGVELGDSPATILGAKGVQSIFETLAQLHKLPVAGLSHTCLAHWLECGSLAANTAKAVALWKAQPYWWPARTSPTLSGALSWLERNVPDDDGPVSLVHVDYGTHNLMIEDGAVTAILDWESARIGDPAEDVTFVLFSLGPDVDREQALAWYRDAGGPYLSDARLRYFDVYNKMKFAISGAYSAGLFEEDGAAAIQWCNLALHIIGGSAGVLVDAIANANAV